MCTVQCSFGRVKVIQSLKIFQSNKMQIKTISILFLVAISSFVSYAFARDSNVIKEEIISDVNHVETKTPVAQPDVSTDKDHKIHGRVICQFEEPTEDTVCQEHCLPKGYSYGICVSGTCSCV